MPLASSSTTMLPSTSYVDHDLYPSVVESLRTEYVSVDPKVDLFEMKLNNGKPVAVLAWRLYQDIFILHTNVLAHDTKHVVAVLTIRAKFAPVFRTWCFILQSKRPLCPRPKRRCMGAYVLFLSYRMGRSPFPLGPCPIVSPGGADVEPNCVGERCDWWHILPLVKAHNHFADKRILSSARAPDDRLHQMCCIRFPRPKAQPISIVEQLFMRCLMDNGRHVDRTHMRLG